MYKLPSQTAKTIALRGVLVLLWGQAALAAPLTAPDFVPDTPATADSVNQAFEAVENSVNDNDARIGTNSTNISTNASDIADLDSRLSRFEVDLSGYSTSFSQVGAAKNVVVLARVTAGGSTIYSIRSRYETSTEQVSIDGVLTDRPFIANYASVSVDDQGNITSISNYIEAPDTSNYIVSHIEESTYDVAALPTWNKTVTADINRETFTCSGNTVLVCFATGRLSNGDVSYIYDWSSNRVVSGPFEVNGFTFNDVRLESFTGTRPFFRVRARGIGEIYRRILGSDGSISERSVIYYRSNGTSGGSLAGTPFDTGQPLDGLFF